MKLPRDNKKDMWQDYSNKEVRQVVEWSRKYFNKPCVLCVFHPLVYVQWLDYKFRMKKSGRHANFDYWIVCYALGI